jgi:hypothetical protein
MNDGFPFTARVRIPVVNLRSCNWMYDPPSIEGEKFVFSLAHRPNSRGENTVVLVITNKRSVPRTFDIFVVLGVNRASRARLEFSSQRSRFEISLHSPVNDEPATSQDYLPLTITILPVSTSPESSHFPVERESRSMRRSNAGLRQSRVYDYSEPTEYIGLPNEGATFHPAKSGRPIHFRTTRNSGSTSCIQSQFR